MTKKSDEKETEEKADALTSVAESEPQAEPAPQAATIKGLTEGRMVHYILPEGEHVGEHRPAIVVRVQDNIQGVADLHVLIAPDDGFGDKTIERVAIFNHANSELGTWHFIEQV